MTHPQQPKRVSDPVRTPPPQKQVRPSHPWIPAEGEEKKEGFSLSTWMRRFGLPIFSLAILVSLGFLLIQVLQSYGA